MHQKINKLTVSLRKTGPRISYNFLIEGPWREAFWLADNMSWFGTVNDGISDFQIDYDVPAWKIPDGIAIIPFLCNILPIAWLYDAEIVVDKIDEDFHHSIEGLKRGYIGMYPDADFGGKLTVKEVVKHTLKTGEHRPIVLFSGGADATFTLLKKLDEKPTLVTLWGSDVFFKQKDIWKRIAASHGNIADELGLSFRTIKTSFRSFLNYGLLDKKFAHPNKATSWWHGFQHGIGLIAHAAPLAWSIGAKKVYIASSYSVYDDPSTTCASWPTIDPFLRFFDCTVEHHDFRYTRQNKIREICELSELRHVPVYLRVCWQGMKSENCGVCEKCVRTMFSVLAEGRDPEKYGFRCDEGRLNEVTSRLVEGKIRPTKFWFDIVERLAGNEAPHVVALREAYERSGKLY